MNNKGENHRAIILYLLGAIMLLLPDPWARPAIVSIVYLLDFVPRKSNCTSPWPSKGI